MLAVKNWINSGRMVLVPRKLKRSELTDFIHVYSILAEHLYNGYLAKVQFLLQTTSIKKTYDTHSFHAKHFINLGSSGNTLEQFKNGTLS